MALVLAVSRVEEGAGVLAPAGSSTVVLLEVRRDAIDVFFATRCRAGKAEAEEVDVVGLIPEDSSGIRTPDGCKEERRRDAAEAVAGLAFVTIVGAGETTVIGTASLLCSLFSFPFSFSFSFAFPLGLSLK